MRHGAQNNPASRFVRITEEPDGDFLDWDELHGDRSSGHEIQYLRDESKSILSKNESPDLPFSYSVNPYRGCVHGCAYCYARPTHEYFGLSPGIDFETRIFVKEQAPDLFRKQLCRSDWVPKTVMFSGVTDCYQPIERQLKLTRQCLEVALEARQPISIVTKNALIARDIDILGPMAELNLIDAAISITTLDPKLASVMEPRTSTIEARFRAVSELSEAGIPVQVMTSPIIPGLNDSELPKLLQRSAEAGATNASYILLRLPSSVEDIFRTWLHDAMPDAASRVEQRIQSTRQGKWNSSEFRDRMSGEGPIAEQIAQTFKLFARKAGLKLQPETLDSSLFRPPADPRGQRTLF